MELRILNKLNRGMRASKSGWATLYVLCFGVYVAPIEARPINFLRLSWKASHTTSTVSSFALGLPLFLQFGAL